MKTLILAQPWASYVISGLKNVVNLPAGVGSAGRFLVCAAAEKPKAGNVYALPAEWQREVLNQQTMGTIPQLEEMPTSVLLGYIDVAEVAHDTFVESIWDAREEGDKLLVSAAFAFSEPQPLPASFVLPEGADAVCECVVSEAELPEAHSASPSVAKLKGRKLSMRASEAEMEEILAAGHFLLWLTDAVQELVLTEPDKHGDRALKPIDTVTFRLPNGTKRTFEIRGGAGTFNDVDERGQIALRENLFGEMEPLQYIGGILGREK